MGATTSVEGEFPVQVRVSSYRVSIVPEDDQEAYLWDITVDWRGPDSWAVIHFGNCLSSDGEWDWEPSPSNRDEQWLARHRFSESDALRRAQEVVSTVRVNRTTAGEFMARRQEDSGPTSDWSGH